MLKDQLRFWQHLRRSKNVWAWIKLSLWRRRQLFAFIVLTIAVGYAILSLQNQREARANDILASLAQGSVQGCITQNENVTQPLHTILVDSYKNSVGNIRRLADEGTLTVPQSKRILKDARDQTQGYLDAAPYRNCRAAGARFYNQISDPMKRAAAKASVDSQAQQAADYLKAKEPKLPAAPK